MTAYRHIPGVSLKRAQRAIKGWREFLRRANRKGQTRNQAIGRQIAEAMTPATIQVALEVFEELRRRHEEVDTLYLARIERACQEAELARSQFLRVNPENRLVADALEQRRRAGQIRAVRCNQKEYLHEPPNEELLKILPKLPRGPRPKKTTCQTPSGTEGVV